MDQINNEDVAKIGLHKLICALVSSQQFSIKEHNNNDDTAVIKQLQIDVESFGVSHIAVRYITTDGIYQQIVCDDDHNSDIIKIGGKVNG